MSTWPTLPTLAGNVSETLAFDGTSVVFVLLAFVKTSEPVVPIEPIVAVAPLTDNVPVVLTF